MELQSAILVPIDSNQFMLCPGLCHSLKSCALPLSLLLHLHIICHFPLVAFNILSLSLIFVSLITVYLGVFLFWFILPGRLCFLDLVHYFLSQVRKVFIFQLLSFQMFSQPFDEKFLTYSFPDLEPVCCSMSGSNCCFLTCIQVSQKGR